MTVSMSHKSGTVADVIMQHSAISTQLHRACGHTHLEAQIYGHCHTTISGTATDWTIGALLDIMTLQLKKSFKIYTSELI